MKAMKEQLKTQSFAVTGESRKATGGILVAHENMPSAKRLKLLCTLSNPEKVKAVQGDGVQTITSQKTGLANITHYQPPPKYSSQLYSIGLLTRSLLKL